MAEMKLNETSLLGASKKSYGRSYGTTQRSVQETYIKHTISPADTLQGIALKYGVSVERNRRANKLYTNDSIFLRSSLSIPVGDQPLPAHVLESATASANNKPIHGALQTNVIPENSSSEDEAEEVKTEEKKEDNHHEEETKRDTTMDFFNRIDRELRQEKTKMVQIENTSKVSEYEAMRPQVVSERSPSEDPVRRSSTPGSLAHAENSYQHGTVRMSIVDRRRSVDMSKLERRRSADIVAMPNFSGKGVLRIPVWAE
ncbi:uncharacterized protein [Amphiura filiformis]|uniref:uncharacterized protein isoform X2 n=1 Tax=Amphiura filiformis TaxID=82378 RepID=UPI003B219627